jgi:hypothetical protein
VTTEDEKAKEGWAEFDVDESALKKNQYLKCQSGATYLSCAILNHEKILGGKKKLRYSSFLCIGIQILK